MKNKLDELVKKYETPDFIKNDPIQFPHRFSNKADIEISAFISSLFAFGRREAFIKKLDYLFKLASPYELILDYKKYDLENFVYRFIKSEDLIELLFLLNKLYVLDKSSLAELFYEKKDRFQRVTNYFYSNSRCPNNQGFCFMFAKPENKSALKRINMFLRWMVRDGLVDFGLWDFINKNELIIPLDTHVARLSREFNLLNRKQNDFRAALELTQKLKEFDPNDPVKYDFALFGLGVDSLSNLK